MYTTDWRLGSSIESARSVVREIEASLIFLSEISVHLINLLYLVANDGSFLIEPLKTVHMGI